MVRAILTDIEGTTTPIRFVTDVLYPFARQRLPDFLRGRAGDSIVSMILAEVQAETGRSMDLAGITTQLLAWMDADRKVAPLKDLQGIIWEQGYSEGALQTKIYTDAARRLKQWHGRGMKLYVFSSGSVPAQRAIFSHTDAGNLDELFSGHFDTRIGHKRDPDAYRRIAETIGLAPYEILFLSDVREELDAAREAGMNTNWLVRERMPSAFAAAHRQVRSFDQVRV